MKLILNKRLQSSVSIAENINSKDWCNVASKSSKEPELKRFWKNVYVKKSNKVPLWNTCNENKAIGVYLDSRLLKTPGGNEMVLSPNQSRLAHLVGCEWESQKAGVRIHALPLTSLVARAIDGLMAKEQREPVIDHMMSYFDTDAICYHEVRPDSLVELQQKLWNPVIEWAEKFLGEKLQTTTSIICAPQSEGAKAALRKHLEALSPFQLAGLEKSVTCTKSILLSLALIKSQITVKQAADAARAESLSQIGRWGFVEDAHDIEECDIEQQLGACFCVSFL